MSGRTRKRAGFLDSYRVDERWLVPPDKEAGRPGICEAFSADGSAVLVKTWPRLSKAADRDIEAVWSHELRQLHRLAGYPGANDLLPELIDAVNKAK